MGLTRAHVIVSGRVQGVAFRYYTRKEAGRLNLTGWVRNLPNGNVEAVFEGEPERVEDMIRWCRQGPPSARVIELRVDRPPATGEYDRFDIAE